MRAIHLFLCFFLLIPSLLWAQSGEPGKDDLEKAEALFREAERHYNVGEYEEALGKYKQAYLLSGLPELVFNIGQCHRKLGHYDEALKSYRTYLRSLPPENENRSAIEKIIKDTEAEQAAAISATTPVTPPEEEKGPASPLPWFGGAGVGVALGAVLGGLSISAANRSRAAAEVPFGVEPDFAEIEAQRQRALLFASLSTASFVAAAASGGVGVLISTRARRVEAKAQLLPGGVTISVRY